jgi:hypothetical protein
VLRTVVFVLVMLWLVGFVLHVAGSLIHILLGIALVVLVVDMIKSSRSTA